MKKYAVLMMLFTFWAGQAWAVELKTDKQRFSYMIGLRIGQQLKGDKIDLDEKAFMAAIRDAASGAKPQLSEKDMQATIKRVQEKKQKEASEVAKKNREEGEQFLKINKSRPGVKELAGGLQYKVIKAGTGATPKATDTVEVDYRGTLLDGRTFDSSYSRGKPATFPVNGVIQGWQEALQAMKEGAKWTIYVPSDLAYGSRGAGGMIGPNSTLIFEVELHKIVKHK